MSCSLTAILFGCKGRQHFLLLYQLYSHMSPLGHTAWWSWAARRLGDSRTHALPCYTNNFSTRLWWSGSLMSCSLITIVLWCRGRQHFLLQYQHWSRKSPPGRTAWLSSAPRRWRGCRAATPTLRTATLASLLTSNSELRTLDRKIRILLCSVDWFCLSPALESHIGGRHNAPAAGGWTLNATGWWMA